MLNTFTRLAAGAEDTTKSKELLDSEPLESKNTVGKGFSAQIGRATGKGFDVKLCHVLPYICCTCSDRNWMEPAISTCLFVPGRGCYKINMNWHDAEQLALFKLLLTSAKAVGNICMVFSFYIRNYIVWLICVMTPCIDVYSIILHCIYCRYVR